MGELTINKFMGSFLAAALVLFGLRELAHVTFAPPHAYHHDDHGEEKTLNEQFAAKYAYYVEVEEPREDGEPEPVFDLGLILAAADVSSGERSFNAKCATCHSINDGGANGTGPNLHGIMGAPKNKADGFNYSGALPAGEQWTYAAMNDWLYNPSAYAAGTSMAFAGLRRDNERANVIAYLAQQTPDAPAFPEPLPAVEPAVEAMEEETDPA
ncbi:MAG: c-type cytochrome [Pseudomonadota bacterium]